MSRATPGAKTLRNAVRRIRDWRYDVGIPTTVALALRHEVLSQPVGSLERRHLVSLYRGYLAGIPTPDFVKWHQHPDLPDEIGEDIVYRTGLAAGEILARVMWELAVSLSHEDLKNLLPLFQFAFSYASSVASVTQDGSRRPDWLGDSTTLMRLHAASCYEAESRGYGVGERIELEFLRALARRLDLAAPSDAVALIAERRRDSKNLPSGLEWVRLRQREAAGGPEDGARAYDRKAAAGLRDSVRLIEWEIILDKHGDGAMAYRGALAGLTTVEPVPVLRSDNTDQTFHNGRLGGSLQAAFVRARGDIGLQLKLALAAYVNSLGSPAGQSLLARPQPEALLTADALARHHVRSIRHMALDDADALACFHWLADQLQIPVTPEVLEKREHVRIVVRRVKPDAGEPPRS
jgi:hypothetical protein